MAQTARGAFLSQGGKACGVYLPVGFQASAPGFYEPQCQRGSGARGSSKFLLIVSRVRDLSASNRRLAEARDEADLPKGRTIRFSPRLLRVQAYGVHAYGG